MEADERGVPSYILYVYVRDHISSWLRYLGSSKKAEQDEDAGKMQVGDRLVMLDQWVAVLSLIKKRIFHYKT